MNRNETFNFPPDKFLISVYKFYLYATYTKWTVSHKYKPYDYAENRVGLDYFLKK